MANVTRLVIGVLGATLVMLAVGLLLSGGFTLLTREPPTKLHFAGISLLLIGASPLIGGITILATTFGLLPWKSPVSRFAIGISVAALGIAFVLAPRY